jgi:hypothetical protein
MENTPRWVIVVVVVVLVIGLIAFARGREHRHGDDVGVRAAASVVDRTSGSDV